MTALHQSYWQNEILNGDPVGLVRLLYREASRSIAAAKDCLGLGDIPGRTVSISKASAILNELALSLDHARGGEISRGLVEIYDYVQRLLQEANFQQSAAPLEEAHKLVETLREAWEKSSTASADGPATDCLEEVLG